jgi:hypothetical protein
VHEYIEHIILECPLWECHRRNIGTLAQEISFKDFVRQFAASSTKDITTLLLGGVPPSLHGGTYFTWNGSFFPHMVPSPPSYCFLCNSCIALPNVVLCEMGLAPSCITRMGRRMDAWGMPFLASAGYAFILVCMLLEGFLLAKLQQWPRCAASAIRYGSRAIIRCALT